VYGSEWLPLSASTSGSMSIGFDESIPDRVVMAHTSGAEEPTLKV
jgi:hypothetical protein